MAFGIGDLLQPSLGCDSRPLGLASCSACSKVGYLSPHSETQDLAVSVWPPGPCALGALLWSPAKEGAHHVLCGYPSPSHMVEGGGAPAVLLRHVETTSGRGREGAVAIS